MQVFGDAAPDGPGGSGRSVKEQRCCSALPSGYDAKTVQEDALALGSSPADRSARCGRHLRCRVIVGGAVVTAEYAESIGADGYSVDAYGAVALLG